MKVVKTQKPELIERQQLWARLTFVSMPRFRQGPYLEFLKFQIHYFSRKKLTLNESKQ